MASDKPDSINGGCLCGSVRFTINFPADHNWETAGSTCQCVQCRKNSGALIARFHSVLPSSIVWTSDSTLKTFRATPPCERGFCGRCGGFLFFRDERSSDGHVSVLVGTFDKEDLKKWGEAVTSARTHLWCEDEVPGVTDHLQGDKWRLDCEGETAERVN